MIMFELYRFAGIAIVLLGFMYILICLLLKFFKYNTLLNKIFPKGIDDIDRDCCLIAFSIFGLCSLFFDISVPTACVSAFLSSIILFVLIVCLAINVLISFHKKLPER
ncbi:hypothetical protein DIDNDMLP_00187 [Klebsiella phage KP13-7]|uniref:DUF3784 domain-containing protein n=1 Tax=Klebsiella phage vB_KleM_RaK2 TaxID=1147094 RepID=H6X487_9CAUD|nr:hypothetical protein F403_gp255 [Klebsiella phage vB_KleM_RaK2]AFA44553.1 hypothetical protein RaK2_00280 [Klebsiella phage vB_KleM_RaK2]UYL05172.1 hypothetical protein DIDNDMLP_00187 [Klebsiella phage KP13-7]